MSSSENTEIVNTKPKPYCFVLMPFDEIFKDVYHRGIKPACNDADAFCERVDEQIYQGAFIERIYNQISKADLVIADMTGQNPNVFYEVGYAHALGKSTVLLTSKVDDIPSDLRHLPHVIYDGSLTKLYDELKRHVEWFSTTPVEKHKDANIKIDLFIGKHNLSSIKLIEDCQIKHGFFMDENVTIHNAGVSTLRSGSYTFNIISKCCRPFESREYRETKLPSGEWQLTLIDAPNILPDSYHSVYVNLEPSREFIQTMMVGDIEPLKFKIITDNGYREFPIRLKLIPDIM